MYMHHSPLTSKDSWNYPERKDDPVGKHKGAFRDALCLHFGWQLNKLPSTCACGLPFNVDHAMICNKGGYPTIRHNEIRDITADLFTKVCRNVAVEPTLQPISNKVFHHRSAKRETNSRLDIRANGFWTRSQEAFFDVRIFYLNASSN